MKRTVRGVRDALPGGVVVGRQRGRGAAELIATSVLAMGLVGGQAAPAGAGAVVLTGLATGMSQYALGNTTNASSGTRAINAQSVSGGGIISVGYSNGVMLISATVAASATSYGASFYGNTTNSSSGTLPFSALAFSGAAGVSVGYSNGTILISGATGAASATSYGASFYGNTTNASSGTIPFSAFAVSGAGGASVGYSNGTVLISAPTAYSGSATSYGASFYGNTTNASSGTLPFSALAFSGAAGATVGYSNGTILISAPNAAVAQTLSYFEPHQLLPSGASAVNFGTMQFVPLNLPQILTLNQVRHLGSRSISNISLNVTTAAAVSGTATASGGITQTVSLVHYTRADNTTYTSEGSTTATYGLNWSFSVSRTGASNTCSATISYAYPIGSTTSLDTYSTTASSAANATFILNVAQSSSYSSWMGMQIPWATSFGSGFQVVGVLWSSATATATGQTWLSIAPQISNGVWGISHLYITAFGNTGIRTGPGQANVNAAWPWGAGWSSAAGNTAPASVTLPASSAPGGTPYGMLWLEMGMF